ncbi:MAG: hypothetical protein FWE31_04010 [Firmicutes bacterium]|nr:hypothetical protein [Bacillota bacterium]
MARTGRRQGVVEHLMYFLSFAAVILIGIVLLIAAVIDGDGAVVTALTTIAHILAYIAVAFFSFFFVFRRPRHRIWYIIAWAVAVTLIVLHYILGMI